jgi:hypothetical protein
MIKKLINSQVHDPARGSFFVKVEGTKEKSQGKPVFVSKTEPLEQKFVITDVEVEA